jgi:hypothetical protein
LFLQTALSGARSTRDATSRGQRLRRRSTAVGEDTLRGATALRETTTRSQPIRAGTLRREREGRERKSGNVTNPFRFRSAISLGLGCGEKRRSGGKPQGRNTTLGVATKRRSYGLTGVAGVDAAEIVERGANAGNLMRGGTIWCPTRWYRFEDETKVMAGS